MKEAYLYQKLPHKKVQCRNCPHYCLLEVGQRGKCGVRENIDGKLFALNYQKLIALHIDPIEKKPFYHFLPGTHSLSIATVGKNIPPEEIVEIALKNNLPSISYTYTEPTIFLEYALDTMKLAKKKGLKNNWVSNGFLSPESAKLVIPYLDAINIDLKSFSDKFYQEYCGGRLEPVLETAKLMKKSGVWVEITTLVIPTLSDSEETFQNIANFIKKELGSETPWHISQFCGALSWQLKDLPDTSIETLENAWQIGKKTGLKYVYLGNAPGHQAENTYCPKCNTLVIKRTGYHIERYDKKGKCPKCNQNLNLTLASL